MRQGLSAQPSTLSLLSTCSLRRVKRSPHVCQRKTDVFGETLPRFHTFQGITRTGIIIARLSRCWFSGGGREGGEQVQVGKGGGGGDSNLSRDREQPPAGRGQHAENKRQKGQLSQPALPWRAQMGLEAAGDSASWAAAERWAPRCPGRRRSPATVGHTYALVHRHAPTGLVHPGSASRQLFSLLCKCVLVAWCETVRLTGPKAC